MTELFFYKGQGLICLAIRWFTKARGQSASDVPTHIGIRVGAVYYEAVLAGVTKQLVVDVAEPDWIIPVKVKNAVALLDFLNSMVGKHYDLVACGEDFIGHILPKWVRILDRSTSRFDCSRLIFAALKIAGIQFPEPILEPRIPITPNQIYLFFSKGIVSIFQKS